MKYNAKYNRWVTNGGLVYRYDNSVENLKLVTHKENCNNTLTKNNYSEARKGKHPNNTGKTFSEFGTKFKEYFGITYYENPKLYSKEYLWFRKHHKCRWES